VTTQDTNPGPGTTSTDNWVGAQYDPVTGLLYANGASISVGGSGGGGLGTKVSYSPSSGTIDPSITGFTAGLGSAGTGRLNVTLSGNTTFEGLPAGADGQQLAILIVSGNYTLTLSSFNASTAQKKIVASGNPTGVLYDALSFYYDASTTINSATGTWIFNP
jgi:hypothetical protein